MTKSTLCIDFLGLQLTVFYTFDPVELYAEVTKILHKGEDIFPLFEEDAYAVLELEAKCLAWEKEA